ncbi:MAG: hypothetical protein IJM56_00540 [Clostridia bacterium]|nr:hypothetical protein [Clostridia bacterium]
MAELTVNALKTAGKIKPLNGLCNAPQLRTLKYWQKAAVPYTRLHDSFLGLWHVVDVSAVFPDFSKDENDPASYDFGMTDRYIKKVLESGAQIVYRLGETIYDMPDLSKITAPPANYEKWGRICAHIVKHYNEGWNGGYHYGIKYWEIWNEPDSDIDDDCMLKGTFKAPAKEFYRFYAEASHTIKQLCPGVLIGGYAPCAVNDPGRYEFFLGFLDYMDAHPHAFDFMTFHAYADSADKLKKRLRMIDDGLRAHGLENLPLIATEVGYFWENRMWAELGRSDNEYRINELVEDMRSARAAAFYACALCIFQNSNVTIANFYRTDYMTMWENLFTEAGSPRKPYWALEMFRCLREAGDALPCDCVADGVFALAAGNTDRCVLYIAQYTGIARRYSFEANGLQGEYRMQMRACDDVRNDEVLEEYTVTAVGSLNRELYLRPCSVYVIEIEKTAKA